MSQHLERQTYTFQSGKLVDIIRDMSYARKVFPVGESIPVEMKRFAYWDITEEDRTQYNFDLVSPEYSRFAALEKNPAIPIHQGNLAYKRHELKNLGRSVFKLDARQRAAMEQINTKEHSVAFGGHTATGVTSFADSTLNSTAYASSLDLTSFATFIKTWQLSVSQLRALLKDKFAGATLIQVWTTDADDRARSCLNTYETETAYDYLVKQIGADNIIATNYLGSAAGTGTTNAALVPKDIRNLELVSSNLEIVTGLTTLKNLEVEMALRSRPLFYRGVKSSLYDASVDITP